MLDKYALSKRVAARLLRRNGVDLTTADEVALRAGGAALSDLAPAARREVVGRLLLKKNHAMSRLLTRTRLEIRDHYEANRRVANIRRAGYIKLRDGSFAVVSPRSSKQGVVASYLAPYMIPKGPRLDAGISR